MLIEVKVKTKAKESKAEKLKSGVFKVSVKSLPTKGKANQEVTKLLAKLLGVPQSAIKLQRGKTTKTKYFSVVD